MNHTTLSLIVQDSFDQLSPSSIELLKSEPSPFLDYYWFRAFSKYVVHAMGQPQWLVLSNGDSTMALMPMVARKIGRCHILQSMTNYYCPYFDIIANDISRAELTEELIKRAKPIFDQYDRIDILPLIDEVKGRFLAAFNIDNFHCHQYRHSTNWRKLGITDFSEYWSARSSKLRATISRKYRKLLKLEHEIRIYSGDISEKALADYHRVYFKSWKTNEPHPAFIDAIVNQSNDEKSLRLGIIYIDKTPAAAQIWLVRSGTGYIMKLAYDPQFSAFSVGSVLSYKLFEHVIKTDGIQNIDYLTGNDAYKMDWMDSSRQIYGIEIANTASFLGKFFAVRHMVANIMSIITLSDAANQENS